MGFAKENIKENILFYVFSVLFLPVLLIYMVVARIYQPFLLEKADIHGLKDWCKESNNIAITILDPWAGTKNYYNLEGLINIFATLIGLLNKRQIESLLERRPSYAAPIDCFSEKYISFL
jgi:hypothetical protein